MCLCFRKLRDRFKTVSRLLEAEEYEQLMASIKSMRRTSTLSSQLSAICVCVFVEERQLKQRIAEVSRYRRNGITKLEGAGVHARESERVKTSCYLYTQTAASLIY